MKPATVTVFENFKLKHKQKVNSHRFLQTLFQNFRRIVLKIYFDTVKIFQGKVRNNNNHLILKSNL